MRCWMIYGAVHLETTTFVQTKVASEEKNIFSYPLVEMLLFAKGMIPLEEILIGSKLTELEFCS